AEFGKRELLGLSSSQQQQPLGFQLRGMMQKSSFKTLTAHFAAGNDFSSRVLQSFLAACDVRFGLILLAAIKHHGDEAFAFHIDRIGEEKVSFHRVVPVSSVEWGERNLTSPLNPSVQCA